MSHPSREEDVRLASREWPRAPLQDHSRQLVQRARLVHLQLLVESNHQISGEVKVGEHLVPIAELRIVFCIINTGMSVFAHAHIVCSLIAHVL